MREKRFRSIIKTITWRIIALIVSYITARAFGVDIETSIKMVIVANTVSMIAYYYHERAWDKIDKGVTDPHKNV